MWRSSRLWNSLLNSSETALPAIVVSPIYYYINPHVGPIFITLRYHQIIPNFPPLASHADVLRGSSRVPAPKRDEPRRTSAWEANPPCALMQQNSKFAPRFATSLSDEERRRKMAETFQLTSLLKDTFVNRHLKVSLSLASHFRLTLHTKGKRTLSRSSHLYPW